MPLRYRRQHPGLYIVVMWCALAFVLHGAWLVFGSGQMVASPAYDVLNRFPGGVRAWGAAFLILGLLEAVLFTIGNPWWRRCCVLGAALSVGWVLALVLTWITNDALRGSPWLMIGVAVQQYACAKEPAVNPAAV